MYRTFDQARGYWLRTPTGFRRTSAGFRDSIGHTLPLNPSNKDDWAGVERIWTGTYAYLDYRALVHYNFSNHMEFPILDLGEFDEACGDIMRLSLTISDDEELRNDRRLRTALPICKDLPVLYFNGSSSGLMTGRPSILVRGCASLIPGGRHVRWRFIIRQV